MASDSPINSFFYEIGLKSDPSAAKKAAEGVRKMEADFTAAAEDGAKKREAIESAAGAKRLGLAEGLGKILGELEQQRADRAATIKKSEAAQDERLAGERERKERERRARTVAELRQHATRMATFALKLVGGVEATALGIVVAVDRAAKSMERLGYASARAGTTSGKMNATGYAFSQMGSSAEAGQAAVRTLGEKLKENPNGYASYLRSMGVEARKANGDLRDSNDILVDVGESLARIRKSGGALGYSNAKAYGAGLGLDADQVQTAMDPRFRRFVGEQQAIDAKVGTDRDAGVESGSKFETSMRRLETTIDSLKTKVATDLAKNIQPTLDKLADWAAAHGKEISDTVVKVADGIIRLANAVIDNLSKVDWDNLVRVSCATAFAIEPGPAPKRLRVERTAMATAPPQAGPAEWEWAAPGPLGRVAGIRAPSPGLAGQGGHQRAPQRRDRAGRRAVRTRRGEHHGREGDRRGEDRRAGAEPEAVQGGGCGARHRDLGSLKTPPPALPWWSGGGVRAHPPSEKVPTAGDDTPPAGDSEPS